VYLKKIREDPMLKIVRSKAEKLLKAASILLLCASWAQSQTTAKDDATVKNGRSLYTQHCVSCHGVTGTGDGPAATALKVRPADLTRISQKYNGFPGDKVMDWIDGEKFAIGHGTREMPIWGKRFRRTPETGSGMPNEVQALARYLETIQKTK
jgi:mono/diheme cytochrome c family protein